MVTAIVLFKVEPQRIPQVIDTLASIDKVTEVYSVSGRYDVVTLIRVKTNDELADIVTRQFLSIEGIRESETLIAFQAVSKFDLERMFSIFLSDRLKPARIVTTRALPFLFPFSRQFSFSFYSIGVWKRAYCNAFTPRYDASHEKEPAMDNY